MPPCKDQAINHLNDLGYNVIRLPKAGITPLLVLSRAPNASTSTLYGHITDLVVDPAPSLPKVFENIEAGTISGLRTNKLEFNLGISFLKTLLSAIGGKSAGIEAAFDNSSTIEFEYENVLYDTVMPASVTKFLRGATPFIDEQFMTQFNQEGEGYILIDVIKSNSFGFRAYRDSNKGVDIKLDALKGIIGAESKLVIEKKDDLKISCKGGQPLGFGFKACPIWVEIVNGVPQFRLNPNTNQDIDLRGSAEDPNALSEDEELPLVLLTPNQLMTL